MNPKPRLMRHKKKHVDSVFISMFTDISLAMILVMLYTFSPGKHHCSKESNMDIAIDNTQKLTSESKTNLTNAILYITQKGFKFENKEYTDIKEILKRLKEQGVSKVIVVPRDKKVQQLFKYILKNKFDTGIGWVE